MQRDGCVETCIFIIENHRRCLHRFVDTFVKRKTGSSSEATVPRRCRPATFAKISFAATSSTSKLIFTKLRKKGIGPISQGGNSPLTQRIQLRCGPEGIRLRCVGGKRFALLAHLRQQSHGILASINYPYQLFDSFSYVVVD